MQRDYFLKKLILRYSIELIVNLLILSFFIFLLFPSIVFLIYLAINGIVLSYFKSFLSGFAVFIALSCLSYFKYRKVKEANWVRFYCRNSLEPFLYKVFK